MDPDCGWKPDQLRKYNLELEQIPRYSYQDEKVDELIAEQKPVVITGSNLVRSALKWDLDYLENNLGNGDFMVYLSQNHKFKYFDDQKIVDKNNPEGAKGVDFTPPIKKVSMKIGEFTKLLRQWKEGDEKLYLQQNLNVKVGEMIKHDFAKFDWEFCTRKQHKHNWGPLTSNLLLISMAGNVTPCHYDEQQNLFAQIHGFKRCILFSPDQFDRMYPYPVYHPHDRQSMVDFDDPDYQRFPKFREAKGCEAVIGPGDVLYIPTYWWHDVESVLNGGPTVSVNFWYKTSGTNVSYPLKATQKVAIMRNIEKMLVNVLQDPNEVPSLLRTMVLGRYID